MFLSFVMRRLFHSLVHSLPSPAGARLDRRLRGTGLRTAQLVSFLEATGGRGRDPDAYERAARRREAVRWLVRWGVAFAVAWVAIESARAVTLF